MEKELSSSKKILRDMGIGSDTKQILMQLGFGAVLGIALLVFCAIGEWLCSMW